jgi:hypothetical protein
MNRQEMMQHFDEPPTSERYVIVGITKDGEGEIMREFSTLSDAKAAGLKLWASGLVCSVCLHKPFGKTHRLVKDDRCTKAKRGKMTWTR